jgi:hypothetical protein
VTDRTLGVGLVTTAGESVAYASELSDVTELIRACADGTSSQGESRTGTVQVAVEASRRPFPTDGWRMLSRDAWERDGTVVIRDVCTSGFDVSVGVQAGVPRFVFRRRPPARTRALAIADPSRALLLQRSVLLTYPAMWWAATRGRAPLHAACLSTGDATPLLVGPSGSGKTTVVARNAAEGGSSVSDNLVVGDGITAWGVVEPIRTDQGTGRAMPHGRREGHLPHRVSSLIPDRVVVLRRGDQPVVHTCSPEDAARWLVASTYGAGELRRFWGLAALLAMGIPEGPAHPPVARVADLFAQSLTCLDVTASVPGVIDLALEAREGDEVPWTSR